MEDQKLENLLNLALGATEEEREKSLNLDVGYHPIDREWELIIKYSGNLDQVRALASQVVELQNEYAIIRINQSRIDLLSDIPEVEYIEKPKRLFFQIANGKRVSCINEVQDTPFHALDDAQPFKVAIFENADTARRPLHEGQQALLVIVAQRRCRYMQHPRHLSDCVHKRHTP